MDIQFYFQMLGGAGFGGNMSALHRLTHGAPPSIRNPTPKSSGMALSSRNGANALMILGFHIRETAARQDPNLRAIAMRPFLVW
jgi:hypothetical protein